MAPGRRCQSHSYKGKPLSWLHAARGWRARTCPTCQAPAGEACHTPSGRIASRPHTARLHYGRRELTVDAVWQELEQYGARAAIVRFHGGAGKPGGSPRSRSRTPRSASCRGGVPVKGHSPMSSPPRSGRATPPSAVTPGSSAWPAGTSATGRCSAPAHVARHRSPKC